MRRAFLAVALCASFLAGPGEAALVVLEEGRHLKVTSFELVGEERIRLVLYGGGEIVLPIERVERIVDDEVDPRDFLVPEEAIAPPAGPRISVRTPSGRPHSAPTRFAPIVEAAAAAYRLDPALVAAVIRVESNWQPRAVSPKGARGLMQLMPATARRLGVTRSFDPAQNVHGGAKYLSLLAERFGENEAERVLAAYNAGEGAVETYQGVPPYRETREYVRKVHGPLDGKRLGLLTPRSYTRRRVPHRSRLPDPRAADLRRGARRVPLCEAPGRLDLHDLPVPRRSARVGAAAVRDGAVRHRDDALLHRPLPGVGRSPVPRRRRRLGRRVALAEGTAPGSRRAPAGDAGAGSLLDARRDVAPPRGLRRDPASRGRPRRRASRGA